MIGINYPTSEMIKQNKTLAKQRMWGVGIFKEKTVINKLENYKNQNVGIIKKL